MTTNAQKFRQNGNEVTDPGVLPPDVSNVPNMNAAFSGAVRPAADNTPAPAANTNHLSDAAGVAGASLRGQEGQNISVSLDRGQSDTMQLGAKMGEAMLQAGQQVANHTSQVLTAFAGILTGDHHDENGQKKDGPDDESPKPRGGGGGPSMTVSATSGMGGMSSGPGGMGG